MDKIKMFRILKKAMGKIQYSPDAREYWKMLMIDAEEIGLLEDRTRAGGFGSWIDEVKLNG